MVDSRAARVAIGLHRAVLRASGGRLGTRLGHLEQVLLTTVGRRTGRPWTTPLAVTVVGDRLVLVASNGGAARHPAWYLNLVANPVVTIEVGTERFRARARTAEEPERTRLFDAQVRQMPFFEGYRRRVTDREIPVVVFERLPEAPEETA